MLSLEKRKNSFGNLGIRTHPSINKGQKNALKKAQKLAESKGGKCLSKEYINYRFKLEWECEKGHRWETPPFKSQQYWCPECRKNIRKIEKQTKKIKRIQKLAESKGGKCISKEYNGSRTKHEWECKKGHKWKATPTKI